jgi:hypothetical protein
MTKQQVGRVNVTKAVSGFASILLADILAEKS